MKLRLMLAMVLMAACTDSVFASVSTEAATALARRILGEQCDRIRFQDVSRNKADAEFFTVEDSDGGVLVSGTGAPAMAMGLNWYLRYRCKVDVSWYSHDPVRLPSSLPVVGEPFTSEARVANRFFLNYYFRSNTIFNFHRNWYFLRYITLRNNKNQFLFSNLISLYILLNRNNLSIYIIN